MDIGSGGKIVPRWVGRSWVAILFGVAGLLLVVGPSVFGGRIPGDLGDARFNSYVLEHFYRWVTLRDHSFWSADFFYPFPLTIAFSDNYLGTGLLYSLFRLSGLDREDAFRLWFVAGYVANFGAASYALSRIGYSRLAAATGAFLFAFALPMTAQEGHAQLVYRFGVPFAVLALVEFIEHRRLRHLWLVAFWTTWEFFCAIYLGYFLALLIFALSLALVICHVRRPIAELLLLPATAMQRWNQSPLRAKIVVALWIGVFLGLMALLCVPYLEASHLYGFKRSWNEIATMLPRPTSYLLAPDSRIWPSSGVLFNGLPMIWEHGMFIGLIPIIAILVGALLRVTGHGRRDRLFVPFLVAVGLLVALTLWVHGHSAYYFVASLPGANAIRSVTRIIVVLLFPLALLVASSLDSLISAKLPWISTFGAALLALLLLGEASAITHSTATKAEWRARTAAIQTELPALLPAAPILLVGPRTGDPGPYLRELDAMIFAQDRGWPTLNGYSGNEPPRHEADGLCTDIPNDLVTGLTILRRNSEADYLTLARSVVTAGYPTCDPQITSHRPIITLAAGSLPASVMSKVRLRIESLSLVSGRVMITAAVVNESAGLVPAGSSTGTPMHIAARYVDADQPEAALKSGSGWGFRRDLVSDVAPGTTEVVVLSFPAPPHPGSFRVAVSLVQEQIAWFHDRGMKIPISAQTVVLDQTLHLLGTAP